LSDATLVTNRERALFGASVIFQQNMPEVMKNSLDGREKLAT